MQEEEAIDGDEEDEETTSVSPSCSLPLVLLVVLEMELKILARTFSLKGSVTRLLHLLTFTAIFWGFFKNESSRTEMDLIWVVPIWKRGKYKEGRSGVENKNTQDSRNLRGNILIKIRVTLGIKQRGEGFIRFFVGFFSIWY